MTPPKKRVPSFLRRLPIAFALLGTACIAADAQTVPADFEARLNALRNALIDSALQAPTRVRTAAWIDEEGRLHESTHISSDVSVRGVRVESYLDEAGVEREVVDVSAVPLQPAEKLFCGVVGQGLKRQGDIEVDWRVGDDAHESPLTREAVQQASALLIRRAASGGRWVISPSKRYATQYEQLIAGTSGEISPYRIRLSGQARRLAASPNTVKETLNRSFWAGLEISRDLPPRTIELGISLQERISGRVVWQGNAQLVIPAGPVRTGSETLSAGSLNGLDNAVTKWLSAIDAEMSCAPMYFSVSAAGANEYRINAGSRAGLRVGDKLVIASMNRLPGQILENGALEEMALAQVESVRADSAILRRVAGKVPAIVNDGVVAMPL